MAEMIPPQHHTAGALWDAHIDIDDYRETWDGDDPEAFTAAMRAMQDRASALAMLHALAEPQARYVDPIDWIWALREDDYEARLERRQAPQRPSTAPSCSGRNDRDHQDSWHMRGMPQG